MPVIYLCVTTYDGLPKPDLCLDVCNWLDIVLIQLSFISYTLARVVRLAFNYTQFLTVLRVSFVQSARFIEQTTTQQPSLFFPLYQSRSNTPTNSHRLHGPRRSQEYTGKKHTTRTAHLAGSTPACTSAPARHCPRLLSVGCRRIRSRAGSR